MLVSVAIAMGFSYPTVALSENPTAGITAHPHTVWTTAKQIDEKDAKIDVEMRQVWIHGSYMSALDKDVLKRALAVQESLLGDGDLNDVLPALNDKLRSSALQWGYHSPLMYWNNSATLIESDRDILRTINDQKYTSSSLNVVLRPASVFAGKKFDRSRLRAADALVITLMNKGDDQAGRRWQQRMQSLSQEACEGCALFPSDGHVTRHRIYEFSFTPLSVSEHVALTFAYGAMAVYVLLSLRRMKAFHSRFGLVVTAITQMTCSILSSFTICGILHINLAVIPQNAYPFVVLVLGVENVFRLINAVLAYPPTMATELRIANALGDIGPLSIAAAAQNLTILGLLSTVVSPGVAAFCAFAAIATLFDAFFLLTFFVAVLSVDIHRLELQDAIAARHNRPRRQRPSTSQNTWVDALLRGRLPFSTRMAGTAVTATFVLSLNFHFFEHKERTTTLRDLLGLLRGSPTAVEDIDTFAPPPINASLTPGQWMRMQDFDTAKEVMKLAKPGADSFVIRLFAPLVVVLEGSDRTDVPTAAVAWSQALRSFAVHHFYPVSVAIVFIVAFVAVLMNFLLYNANGDEENDTALEHEKETLMVDTVFLPHRLDVVKLAGSESGHFATIGLDRSIVVSIADRLRRSYMTVTLPTQILADIRWPIRHLTIDESGELLAFHCADDRICLYNTKTGNFSADLAQYPDDHPAMVFTFLTLPSSSGARAYFLTLTSGGRLAMSSVANGLSISTALSPFPLMGATLTDGSPGRQLYIVTMEAKIYSFSWSSGEWVITTTTTLQVETENGHLTTQIGLRTYANADAEMLLVTTPTTAIVLNSLSLCQLAKFSLSEANSLVDNLLLGPSRRCPACGSIAVRQTAAVNFGSISEDLNMTTWSVKEEGEGCICLTSKTTSCTSLDRADRENHTVLGPGAWSIVRSQAIIGLRKCRRSRNDDAVHDRSRASTAQLRQRRRARSGVQAEEDLEDQWEAYKLSMDGHMQVAELDLVHRSGGNAPLFVENAGPAVPLDSHSVAVAFGNSVKIICSSRRGSMSRRGTVAELKRQSSISSKRGSIARKTR